MPNINYLGEKYCILFQEWLVLKSVYFLHLLSKYSSTYKLPYLFLQIIKSKGPGEHQYTLLNKQGNILVISSYYYSWLLEYNWRLNKHKWCSSLEAFVKAPSPSSHISIALVLTKKSGGQIPTPFREKAGLNWKNIYIWPEKNTVRRAIAPYLFSEETFSALLPFQKQIWQVL